MIIPRNVKCELILLILFLVLILWTIPAIAITGGEPDGDNHPNVGAMVAMHPEFGPVEICSGTLIHPQVFLTAGHCTDLVLAVLPEGALHVSFSSGDALNPATWLPVAAIITHPDYNWGPTSNPHDVGILILEEPVGVDPATVAPEGFLDVLREEGKLRERGIASNFTAVGYGATLNWPPPEICAPDGVRRFSNPEYKNLRKAWLNLLMNQAPGTDASGVCYGDSGGALFWDEEDTEILVGLTSWGDANCVANANYYRVDIPDTLDFIDLVLGSLAPRKPMGMPSVTWWGRVKSGY